MSARICLIVDDEPAIRTFLRELLEQRQFQILEADCAASALKIVQALGDRLALIVSDIRMPGDMDGLDLAYSVRNALPAIPVILISGYCDKHPDNNPGFEFISKPFAPEAILKAIDGALNPR